ncbi:MAG TPA: sigma-70 family RNA polymerase sigma factor [Allosphingosinicella sp.]|nr:sigma-70 family RNA polymerase sigma factor [Allosphingosinicella sp.]
MRSSEARETQPLAPGAADERALMARAGTGDAAAFNRIVGLHMAMVHGLAWRMLGDAAEAEDVVQECFVKLWVNAKGWAPSGGGLGAWLRRVATNACLDRLRKPKGVSDAVLAEHADETPPADAVLDDVRRREAVAGAIRALPDRQRAAIVLTYYEGASNAEAATILGLGVKALESLLVRARQGLTQQLARQGLIEGGAG